MALLIQSHFDEPIDALLSYSHYTLQNDTFREYLPHFMERAGIKQLYCASPLNMGFFGRTVPRWHPAPSGMLEARERAIDLVQSEGWPGGVADLALGFGLRRAPAGSVDHGNRLPLNIPTVIGLSNLEEVHHVMRVWHNVNSPGLGGDDARRISLEHRITQCFMDSGWSNWSWDTINEM